MIDFATRIVGLELRERAGQMAYVRGDSSHHNICYVEEEIEDVVGFSLASSNSLRCAEQFLMREGVEIHNGSEEECASRRVSEYISFRDPCGNSVELAVGPAETGQRYFPARDAGITSFGHFALHARNSKAALEFWTRVMGLRVSDTIGDGALLRLDEVHHKVALFPSSRTGVQHVNFQVHSVDDVMRSWYFLQEEGIPIAFGPGRHPTSTAIFLYFMGPDGRVYEYSHGVKLITDEAGHVPRHFEQAPTSFCMWGSKPRVAEFSD